MSMFDTLFGKSVPVQLSLTSVVQENPQSNNKEEGVEEEEEGEEQEE